MDKAKEQGKEHSSLKIVLLIVLCFIPHKHRDVLLSSARHCILFYVFLCGMNKISVDCRLEEHASCYRCKSDAS